MDAHGETRPRKRGHSNRKNKGEAHRQVEVPEPEIVRERIVEEDEVADDWSNYHVEEDTGASLVYKILFFVLLLILGGVATLVLIDNNNSIETPVTASVSSSSNNGLHNAPLDEEREKGQEEPEVRFVAASWLDWLTHEEAEDHHIVEEHNEEAREFIDHDHEEDHAQDQDHEEEEEDHDEDEEEDGSPHQQPPPPPPRPPRDDHQDDQAGWTRVEEIPLDIEDTQDALEDEPDFEEIPQQPPLSQSEEPIVDEIAEPVEEEIVRNARVTLEEQSPPLDQIVPDEDDEDDDLPESGPNVPEGIIVEQTLEEIEPSGGDQPPPSHDWTNTRPPPSQEESRVEESQRGQGEEVTNNIFGEAPESYNTLEVDSVNLDDGLDDDDEDEDLYGVLQGDDDDRFDEVGQGRQGNTQSDFAHDPRALEDELFDEDEANHLNL